MQTFMYIVYQTVKRSNRSILLIVLIITQHKMPFTNKCEAKIN